MARDIKYTPIIMSGNHPRLVLDGTKTQSRRVIKPQPYEEEHLEVGKFTPALIDKNGEMYPADYEIFGAYTSDGELTWKCPYGQIGDRLWVRETWAAPFGYDALSPSGLWDKPNIWYYADGEPPKNFGIKRPSIHMPRWASRITLENGERIEVVQAPAYTADDYNPRWAKIAPKWSSHVILPDDLIWHWDWDFMVI